VHGYAQRYEATLLSLALDVPDPLQVHEIMIEQNQNMVKKKKGDPKVTHREVIDCHVTSVR